MNINKLFDEMKKIEVLLDSNFGATGENIKDKLASAKKQLPVGVGEKIGYLVRICERANDGETIDEEELKQSKYWLRAIYPYLTNGVDRGPHWGARIIWLILAAAACYAAYHFLLTK